MAKTIFKPVQYELSQLLGDIDLGKLALPELQRPFVWKTTAVRDLLDSMYRGFPVGYLMLWNAADVDARFIGGDGKQLTPTEFIIDGQQRLTSLYAVMKGVEVTFKDFSKGLVRLAFRPRDGQFAVTDPAIENDVEYLANITSLWTGEDCSHQRVHRAPPSGRPRAAHRWPGGGAPQRARTGPRARGLPPPSRTDRPRDR